MKEFIEKGKNLGNEGIKSFKIVFICLLRWLGIMLVGIFLSLWIIIYSMTKIYIIREGLEANGFFANVGAFFKDINYSVAFIFIVQILMLIGYFIIANKYAIQKAIAMLWERQGSEYISSYIAQLLGYLQAKQPALFTDSLDKQTIKQELINMNATNAVASNLQRRTTNYILSKAKVGGKGNLLQQLTTLRFNPMAFLPALWGFYALVVLQILFIVYLRVFV